MRWDSAVERSIAVSKSMDSEQQLASAPAVRQLPLQRSGKKLSFERRLRFSLYLLGLPGLALIWYLLHENAADVTVTTLLVLLYLMAWAFVVSIVLEQISRPLQTLTNVVAALREDDYSFRARGALRDDAIGDLAIEINALANMLQIQRAGALEAIALVERVVDSMQSPVLAFDRTTPFGFRDSLDYRIVVNWVIAEHKSQGLFQMDYSKDELEQFWLFAVSGANAGPRLESLRHELSRSITSTATR